MVGLTKEELLDIIDKGYDVFETSEKLMMWLTSPCKTLGGHHPFYCGYQDIIDEIERIKYNVYS